MGSKEAVALTEKIIEHARALIETGVESGKARGWMVTLLIGQAFTGEQQKTLGDGMKGLADLRNEFAELARAETSRSWWRR